MVHGNEVVDVLTAVVPITNIKARWPRIAKWIECLPSGVKVIFIHDTTDSEEQDYLLSRLKLIQFSNYEVHQAKYKSPGLSRNLGLSKVETEFICFWDSDDVPFTETIKESLKNFTRETDVVIGQFAAISAQTSDVHTESKDFNLEQIFLRSPGVWRMIFRTEFVKSAQFPNIRMGEDQIFLLSLNLNSANLSFIKPVIYKYYTGGTNQLTTTPGAFSDLPNAIRIILNQSNRADGEYLQMYMIVLVRMLLTSIKHVKNAGILPTIINIYLFTLSPTRAGIKFRAIGKVSRAVFAK